jgi:anaerobic ribonucleoside-triphosphate reductase
MTPSERGRALASLRRRAGFVCEVCGEQFEAWDRKTQPARTCSGKCRARLFRRERKTRLAE